MQIEALQVFCDVVATGSFSGAAERNGLTQSAVSQKVRALELHYGFCMVERGAGRPFRLTAEGHMFYECCRELLAVYEAIPTRLLKVAGDLQGVVRVATVPGLGLYELAEARRRFRREYRGVRVQVEYSTWRNAYELVRDGSVDFALLAYPEPGEGLEIEPCWQEKLVLACPHAHRLSRYGTVSLRDLRSERMVFCAPDEATAAAMHRAFARAKVDISCLFEARNVETALRALEVEGVISVLPVGQLAAESDSYRIVEVNSGDMWRPVGLVRRACSCLGPAAREFARALRGSR